MTQKTETLWQIGKSGNRAKEFVQAGGWKAEFTYVVGSDEDPINKPHMPPLLLVPGRKTKPKRNRKELFATDKLNSQFTLDRDYNAEELTLFYDFLGSETDILFLDGEEVTKLEGVGEGKLKQTQIPLPAVSAGEHTLTLITSGGKDGAHWIDYLKLDGVVVPQQPKTPKKTMAKKNPASATSETSSTENKSYVPTSMTGLQDYSYWWSYCRENAKKSGGNSKPFRRGRIWS